MGTHRQELESLAESWKEVAARCKLKAIGLLRTLADYENPKEIRLVVLAPSETLTSFGTVEVVKHLSSQIALVGGSRDDRAEAREWCSIFLQEAAIASPDAPRRSRWIGQQLSPAIKTAPQSPPSF